MIAPKYLQAVLQLSASLPRGECRFVEVRHDPWCPLLTQSKPCTCEPEVRLRPVVSDESRGPAC
jgi:hypothetical protein